MLDAAVIDGATLALPWYADTRLLFYRSDLFSRARRRADWDDWLARGRARRRRGSARGQHAILLPLAEWEVPVILALQRGATLLRDGDRYGDFASPEFRAAFAFYLELFRRGLAPQTGAAQLANLHQDFAAGAFAALVTGPWNLGEFARRLPAELQARWATAPLPGFGGDAPGVSLAGGASLALVRALAAEGRGVGVDRVPRRARAAGRVPPALGRPAGAPLGLGRPGARRRRASQAFRAQLEHVRATPKIPEWERIASRIAHHAEAAVREERDLDATLAALDRDADRVLEKRRWLLAREGAD